MRPTGRLAGVALVAVLVTGAADPGCGASGNGAAKKACDLRVSKGPWIYRATHAADVEVRGAVFVVCDAPPRSHRLEVWLERDVTDGGGWLLARGTSVRSNVVPDAKGFEQVTRFDGCISGPWRIRARAKGVGPAGTPFDFRLPESESRPTRIRCPGPR